MVSPTGSSRRKPDWGTGHRKTCTIIAFTQVNSEGKVTLAMLVEAIRTDYNDISNKIS